MEFGNEKWMPNKAKCAISAESDSFIFCPIFYSRKSQDMSQREKFLNFSKYSNFFLFGKWSLGMKGDPKKGQRRDVS